MPSLYRDARWPKLVERLRRTPSSSSVPGAPPVLFFGDLFEAEVATVGLNPSHQEYLATDGTMLSGAVQRFATLDSLGAPARSVLSDEQCAQAIEWMRKYYEPGRPVYSWFNSLSRVVEGFGVAFSSGGAAHLDLIQESTQPVWSGLGDNERSRLLDLDLPFLEWQIRSFQLRAIICNGKTVGENARRRLDVSVDDQGALARVRWWVGHAEIQSRRVAFGGWNIPLARPTGLGREGEIALGKLLAEKLGR